jgi:hypothetical protein
VDRDIKDSFDLTRISFGKRMQLCASGPCRGNDRLRQSQGIDPAVQQIFRAQAIENTGLFQDDLNALARPE